MSVRDGSCSRNSKVDALTSGGEGGQAGKRKEEREGGEKEKETSKQGFPQTSFPPSCRTALPTAGEDLPHAVNPSGNTLTDLRKGMPVS